ncbi:MAG: pyruvate dehydrogenase (acetyl-transferring) E1 component subunit alpha [Gammaproteobacteria bacterium]|nr:pyruvate dehydrogenase (acetyl-transferring) E1 component subunit alpha [Gammaproteobacteria bacterium]
MTPTRTVAEFSITCVQRVDETGHADALPAFAADAEELQRMYRMMVRTRLFDTKAINLQRTGQLGTYPPCIGHEGTQVAVGAAMRPEDVLFTVYREIGTKFWRGVSLLDILLYWGGDERGTQYAGSPGDFPFCVPIASQMPQAAGTALAFRMRGEPRCAVAFIGDGGTSEGAFYEAINFAGVAALPLVTIIVNNGWAISHPAAAQTRAQTYAQKAIAAGIPGVQVDGNDAIGVREIVAEALERARSGGGPTLIEALTYRLGDHTTSDDAARYRPAEEVVQARTREPLLRLRRLLEARGWWDEAHERDWRASCSAEIEAAVQAYLATPRQDLAAMFEHVYAELPATLRTQLEDARRHAPSRH